jgi:hypothetical protein
LAKIVSGLIAIVLIGLYAYAVSILVSVPTNEPSPQIGTILGLVGGLVSALVVAVLAATPQGAHPARAFVEPAGSFDSAVSIVIWAYLFVWLGCGAILLYSWLNTEVPAKSLEAAATSWLGLAVAAAYAYLGLKKPSA